MTANIETLAALLKEAAYKFDSPEKEAAWLADRGVTVGEPAWLEAQAVIVAARGLVNAKRGVFTGHKYQKQERRLALREALQAFDAGRAARAAGAPQ